MFCPNCGKDNPEGSKFCCACGTDFLDLLKKTEPVIPEKLVVNNVVEQQPVVNVVETPVEPVVNSAITQQPIFNNTIEEKKSITNKKSSNEQNKNSNVGCFIIIVLVIIAAIIFFVIKGKNSSSKGIINGSEMVSIVRDDNGRPKFIDGTFTDVKVKNNKDAYKALNSLKSELKFNDEKKEFNIESVETNEDITYYKFHQKYKDVEVYGMNLIIAVDKDGNVLSMSGYYIPNINISTSGDKTIKEAEEVVIADLGNNAQVISSDKYIYANDEDASLVYIVNAFSDKEAKEYFVDANTNAIISKNELVDFVAYNFNSPYGEVTIDQKGTKYSLYDSTRNIYIIDSRNIGADPGILFKAYENYLPDPITGYFDNGKFVYSNEIMQDLSSVADTGFEALHVFEEIYDYYKNVLGRDSYDNKGSNIIINIGLKEETFKSEENKLQNAFWFPLTKQMYIGYWGNISFTKSKDVLAHEFTHGVISSTANFASPKKSDKNKPNEPGALNEAYADIMGSLIEGKNWDINDSIETLRSLRTPGQYERPMEKDGEYYFPTYYMRDRELDVYLQANHLDNVYDYDQGGVHHNSTVIGHAAYLMYKNGAFSSMEEEAKVWYNSLFLLSSYSNFEDCALAVIQSAKNLGLSSESIRIIQDAFIETKILDEKLVNISFNIRSNDKGIGYAKIDLKSLNNSNNVYSLTTNLDGFADKKVALGTYEVTITLDGYETYKKTFIINGDSTFTIDLDKLVNDKNAINYEIDPVHLSTENDFLMYVDDTFVGDDCNSIEINECNIFKTFVTGKISRGTINVGDAVSLIDGNNNSKTYVVKELSLFHKKIESASAGENVGIVFEGNIENEISAVQVAAKPNSIKARKGFEAEMEAYTTDNGGMIEPMNINDSKLIFMIYIPSGHRLFSKGKITILNGTSELSPGDKVKVLVQLDDGIVMEVGSNIIVHKISKYGNGIGSAVGKCTVTNVYK